MGDAGALSAGGTCKTFDDRADGYGRGEGCGVVILKRAERARADGDRVIAVLLGSAVNHDGACAGLTVPNGPAQEALIREALANASLSAAAVGYVEPMGPAQCSAIRSSCRPWPTPIEVLSACPWRWHR